MAVGEQQMQSADKLWSALENAFGEEGSGVAAIEQPETLERDTATENEARSSVELEPDESQPVSEPETESPLLITQTSEEYVQPKRNPPKGREEEKLVCEDGEKVPVLQDRESSQHDDDKKSDSPEGSVFSNTSDDVGNDDMTKIAQESGNEDGVAETTVRIEYPMMKGDKLMAGWIIRCKRDCFEIVKTNESGEEISRFFTPRSGGETVVDIGNISIRATSDEIELKG